MDVRDLMIGDFIFSKGNEIHTVQGLDEDVNGRWWYYSPEHQSWCAVDEAKPIPLTPEILEKNGFTEVKTYYPYPTYECREIEKCVIRIAFPQNSDKTKFNKTFYEIDSEWCFIEHINCEFVHELQHAPKLCGINKQIVL